MKHHITIISMAGSGLRAIEVKEETHVHKLVQLSHNTMTRHMSVGHRCSTIPSASSIMCVPQTIVISRNVVVTEAD